MTTNLQLSAYEPNLKDPRVQKRIQRVLAWCDLHLSATSPEPVHHEKLQAVFGNQTNPLSIFLRSNLLMQVGAYMAGKQSYSYVLNQDGYDKASALTKHMVATSAEVIAEQYPELTSLTFTYKQQSDRYWHPLQNIKREKKEAFWKGYLPFNYDIEACAPTILFQCARQAGLPAVTLTTLQGYLDDRSGFRTHVSSLTGLSPGEAKRLINSLFNGAKLAANGFCSAFRLMNYDVLAMGRLQADPQVKHLVREIKRVWDRLELVERHKQQPTLDAVLAGSAAPAVRRLRTSKQKWGYYFSRERQILDAITSELSRAGIKHFTEHDGFRTDSQVDVARVEDVVKIKTGFEIVLSHNHAANHAPPTHTS